MATARRRRSSWPRPFPCWSGASTSSRSRTAARCSRTPTTVRTSPVTGAGTYRSRRSAAAAVEAALERAGWKRRAGSHTLTLRYAEATYRATVTAQTYAPSLAFIVLANPAFVGRDPRSGKVAGDVADHQLSDRQWVRFFAGRTFTPTFVPPGYARWRPGEQQGYDAFVARRAGGRRAREREAGAALQSGSRRVDAAAMRRGFPASGRGPLRALGHDRRRDQGLHSAARAH